MKTEVLLSSEIPPERTEMEPKIIKDVHEFIWNFSDIKANLASNIEKYTGLVVTEDNLKDMEAAQREIAGVRSKIDGFRKTVKKKLEEPYKQFEVEIKELQALIEQAEKPLVDQIKKYEDARVVKLETELLTFAEKTATNLGLRKTYFDKFAIQSAWTKKTAKIAATRKAIVTEIESLLGQQKSDDEAEQLRQQKITMIEQFCEVHSESSGLKTPITPEDVAHQLENVLLPEISGIIIQACHDRQNLEQRAAREAAQENVQVEPPGYIPPMPEQFHEPPAPPSFQPGPLPPNTPSVTPEFVQVPPPPMQPVMPALWDVALRLLGTFIPHVLQLSGITIQQATEFKAYLASHGMEYEVISQTLRGNG